MDRQEGPAVLVSPFAGSPQPGAELTTWPAIGPETGLENAPATLPKRHCLKPRGFTLVELMVTVSLLGLLLALAAPSFTSMLRNAQARSVAETLQSGLRLAQAEAVRLNRQVVFALTESEATSTGGVVAASTNGRKWAAYTVPFPTEGAKFIQAGSLVNVAAGVQITGPASVCLNSVGRLTTNPNPGTGAACALPAAGTLWFYDIEQADAEANADQRFSVSVSLGGQVRLCNRARRLADAPDGCPPRT
jgi:type IV fimbrial biogenesis protein FimT